MEAVIDNPMTFGDYPGAPDEEFVERCRGCGRVWRGWALGRDGEVRWECEKGVGGAPYAAVTAALPQTAVGRGTCAACRQGRRMAALRRNAGHAPARGAAGDVR